MIIKIDNCKNNLEKISTTKIGEHIPCAYSMSTIWALDNIENKHSLYRGEDCTKMFCSSLRKHATNVINFEKNKMLPLTEEKLKLHQDSIVCYICRKQFTQKLANDENYQKVRDHCHFTGKYRGAAYSIGNLGFNVLNEVPVVFPNKSNYDYYFIIKKLANMYKGQFECLGEKQKKYTTFSFSREKVIRKVNKDGNEYIMTISYKIKFIDSARFMASSILYLVDNLGEGIHKIKCKDSNCFLELKSINDDLIKYKCLSRNKNYLYKMVKD